MKQFDLKKFLTEGQAPIREADVSQSELNQWAAQVERLAAEYVDSLKKLAAAVRAGDERKAYALLSGFSSDRIRRIIPPQIYNWSLSGEPNK